MRNARFNRPDAAIAVRVARAWLGLLIGLVVAISGCAPARMHPAPTTGGLDAQGSSAQAARVQFVSPYTYEWFIRAELFAAHGELAQAADAYHRALAGADEDPLVIARLALTLDALGKRDEAQQWLEHGDTLDPESEAIWLARGEIAQRHDERDAAIAAYQRAQTFAPHSAQATLALSALLEDAPERAIEVLRAFRRHNERWSPQRLRVELALALQEQHVEQAVTQLHALQTMAMASPLETEAVARLAWSQQRTWLARQLLGDVTDRAIDRTLWLRVLIAVRDFDAATRVLETATPDDVGGLAAMADFYWAIGDRQRAVELAQLCLARDPHDSAITTLLRAQGFPALAADIRNTR